VSSEIARRHKSVLIIAAIYLVAHLAFLAPSLEDIDSINFALGLRHYDVAQHQPHPPGYPVYIALGKNGEGRAGSNRTITGIASHGISVPGHLVTDRRCYSADRRVFHLHRRLDSVDGTVGDCPSGRDSALLARGSRPMSDMPGLALALVAQALFLKGTTDRRAIVIGAVIAGIAAGVRVQTACLTVPLFAFALVKQRREGVLWVVTRPVAAMALGGLVWAIPLIALSGGLERYLVALGSQAGEDLAWTGMLWTTPTPRRLLFALWETFVLPWDSVPLAIVVGVIALIGVSVAWLRQRRAVLLLALAFAPYAIFHLVFQETVHVRYAMPTLPAMAWLVVCAATIAGRAAPAVSATMVAAALWFALPVGIAYGREAHPAFRAIAAMDQSRGEDPVQPFSRISRCFGRSRPRRRRGPRWWPVRPRRSREWLDPVAYWRDGGRGCRLVSCGSKAHGSCARRSAEPSRCHPLPMERLRSSCPERNEAAGGRWYRIAPPGWFVAEGWGLTPETGGIAQSTGMGVDKRPIEAFVRRRSGPMHLLIGGRHFSAAGDPPVVFTASIEGTPIETWTVEPGPGGVSFLRFVDLPGGLPPGSGDYARLIISARAEPTSRPTPPVAIRQFDIQSSGTLIYGFGEGWHEAEYDNGTGVSWRWSSGRSVLRVSPPQDVEIRMRGESPLKYFKEVPTVKIRAGDRIVVSCVLLPTSSGL
jgi:hypothetical protein